MYQLHIHFKHPVCQHISHDTFRIHSLPSVINNLQIDPEYYAKSVLQLPVYPCTDLYSALGLGDSEEEEPITGSETDPDLDTCNKKCLGSQSQGRGLQ